MTIASGTDCFVTALSEGNFLMLFDMPFLTIS